MTGITKGAWTIQHHTYFTTDVWWVSVDKELIADVTGEANVRLIASAPKLYQALKEITELAPRDKLRLPYAHQVVEIADKALALVEGKEQL